MPADIHRPDEAWSPRISRRRRIYVALVLAAIVLASFLAMWSLATGTSPP